MATGKGRTTFRTGALLLGLALTGCGGLLGDEGEDSALLTVEGTLVAKAPLEEAKAKKLRAALLWEHYPQPTLDCIETLEWPGTYGGCLRKSPRQQFVQRTADVKVGSSFPSTFSMPVKKLPEPAVLHGEEGSRLGIAYVLAYVDGNDNKQLDTVSNTALSSPDTVVGHQEGHTADALAYYWVVYREGALRPLFGKMFDGCAEPPQGYSLVSFRYRDDPVEGRVYDGCFVETGRVELDMTLDPDNTAFQQLVCEQPTTYQTAEWVRPVQPPPPGTTSQCSQHPLFRRRPVLLVNTHPERFCTVANTQVYDLLDPWENQWDDRANPPSWWPCEVIPPSGP
jgi:hypothetical protein